MASTAKYKIIGYSHYDANGKKGFYLNLTENYLVRDGAVGSFSVQMSAPYVDIKKIEAVPMSIDRPATIEISELQQPMGRTMVVMCQEVLSIEPFNSLNLVKSLSRDERLAIANYLKSLSSSSLPLSESESEPDKSAGSALNFASGKK